MTFLCELVATPQKINKNRKEQRSATRPHCQSEELHFPVSHIVSIISRGDAGSAVWPVNDDSVELNPHMVSATHSDCTLFINIRSSPISSLLCLKFPELFQQRLQRTQRCRRQTFSCNFPPRGQHGGLFDTRIEQWSRYSEPEPDAPVTHTHTSTHCPSDPHRAHRACVELSAMCQLQLPSGSLGVFGEAPGLPRTSAPTVLYPGYSCHGICFVALPVAINVCMFPTESDPEGGVISLTSAARMTLHTQRRQEAQRNTHMQNWLKIHFTASLFLALR